MAAPQDSAFSLVWIFSFAVVAVLAVLLFNQLALVLDSAFVGVPEAQGVTNEFNTFLPGFFSWVFTIVFASLPLMGLGLAFLVRIDVFWWWVYSALAIVILAVGWMFQSLWGWFTDVQLVGDAASQITTLAFVFDNYGLYAVFMLALIGFGTYYGKQRSASMMAPGGFR